MKTIQINCDSKNFLHLNELESFQGNLKELSEINLEKLQKAIIKHGFIEPISVWKHQNKNYILNGHQRLRTLQIMQKNGYEIPKLPINYIEANDLKDAKSKVLSLTSQYGEITKDGLYEFIHESDLDIKIIAEIYNFPEIHMGSFKEEFFETEPTSTEIVNFQAGKTINCPKCGFKIVK